MKKVILLISFLPMAFISCNNSNTDKQITNNQTKNNQNMQVTEEQKSGILKAIDLYIGAGNRGDSKTAKEVFVPTATVSWVENGELKNIPVQGLYDFFDQSGPLKSSYELASINVAEDVATVRIESQFGTAKFADMFAMVKDGDKWKIVSKVYHAK